MAAAALGIALLAWSLPAAAAPVMAPGLAGAGAPVEQVRYYRGQRRGPPVYPYYYSPGRPGGWSAYFGFVPYARGNYEIQALQRRYPETNWPPGMRYYPYR
jgi:hypothetical protein